MGVAIVAGAVANKPRNGGEAWVRATWLLGLQRLGFDAYLVERIAASACVDDSGRPVSFARSANRAHLDAVVADLGLDGRVAVVDEAGESLLGVESAQLRELVAASEVLFDHSGNLGPGLARAWGARRRVFVDLDPGFTQTWHADPSLPFSVAGYDRHVTVGLNVGRRGCAVPVDGVDWVPTLPPVLSDEWSAPAHSRTSGFGFSTVATWRSPHGPVSIGGRTRGLKHHALRELIDLPEQVPEADFELSLDIDSADERDRLALHAHGWSVVGARERTATPSAYREYVHASCAEFSVAQPTYVASASGWFSDRTAAYLAAGRAALVQDTGVSASVPCGEGLVTFSTPREAARRAREIARDPGHHARAARELAVRHLDSDAVLSALLERLRVGG